MKHQNLDPTEIKKNQSFIHLFTTRKQLKFVVGVLIAAWGLIGAAAATDFCRQTSQHALEACRNNAKGDELIALGKCDNLSDPTARADCRKQAMADFQNGLQTCQDEFN